MTRKAKFKKLVRDHAKAAGTNYRSALGNLGPARFDSVELRLDTSERQPELFFRPLKSNPDDTSVWAEEVHLTLKPLERAVRKHHPELLEDFALWVRVHQAGRMSERSRPADGAGWRRVGLREARRRAFDVLIGSIEHVGWRYFLRVDIDAYLESEDTLGDALHTELSGALTGLNGVQWEAAEPFLDKAKAAAWALSLRDCSAALRDADAALAALGWEPASVMMPRELLVATEPPDVVTEFVFGSSPVQSVRLEVGQRYRGRASAENPFNAGRPCELICFGAQDAYEHFAWVKWLDNGRRGEVSLYDLENVDSAAAA